MHQSRNADVPESGVDSAAMRGDLGSRSVRWGHDGVEFLLAQPR